MSVTTVKPTILPNAPRPAFRFTTDASVAMSNRIANPRYGGGGSAAFPNVNSVAFDGVDDSSSVRPGILDHEMNYSGSFWFKLPVMPTVTDYMVMDGMGSVISINPSGTLAFGTVWYINYGFGSSSYSSQISADTWYHLVWTRQRNSGGASNPTFSHYLNGALLGSATNVGDRQSYNFGNNYRSDSTGFFGSYNATSGYVNCIIDEIALFSDENGDSGVLSATDVADIYGEGAPGDLTAYNPRNWYRMGDGTGDSASTVYDMGSDIGTTTDMTLVNASYSTDVPQA